jgi:pilus assembly protein CpaB
MLIGAALVVAVGAAFLARFYLLGSQPETPELVARQDVVKIVVAANNLPMGHIIELGDVSWQDWPSDNINANYMQEESYTLQGLEGSVIRYGITAGEPLTTLQTVSPGERGFLAAILKPGMRAITIPVARTTGLAGFVFPGDRVDLILTQRLEVESLSSIIGNASGGENDQAEEEHEASITFLRNVRVLAVDTRTDDMAKIPQLSKSVTLEVTPKMAERVTVGLRLGTISLALRSLTGPDGKKILALNPDDEMPSISPRSHTWDYQASHLVRPVLQYQDIKTVVVTRGGKSQILILGSTGDMEIRDKDAGR